jgi:hypothetical protein
MWYWSRQPILQLLYLFTFVLIKILQVSRYEEYSTKQINTQRTSSIQSCQISEMDLRTYHLEESSFNLCVKTTIHHIDTVSVMVACSLNPVAADIKGLVRLSNALTRVEERLLRYIDWAPPSLSLSSIPDHESWIVTM